MILMSDKERLGVAYTSKYVLQFRNSLDEIMKININIKEHGVLSELWLCHNVKTVRKKTMNP